MLAEADNLTLPIGWSHHRFENLSTTLLRPVSVLETLIGWLITALAISLGAPFWFDVLNKFMVIRSTVKPTEKSQPEASEDRR